MASRKEHIGLRSVKTLKPGEILWDAPSRTQPAVSGFGVRCQAMNKTYILKARIGGRQRWITIGRHGDWTPDAARTEAARLRREIDAGKDPTVVKKREKDAPTIAKMAEEWIEQHVASLAPGTQYGYELMLNRYVIPRIGKLKAHQVTPSDVVKMHKEMVDTPYMANYALRVLRSMFNWAEDKEQGYRPKDTNPCAGRKLYEEVERDCVLDESEMARIGKAMADVVADGSESIYPVAAIKLLMLTGCRRNEILSLQWKDVDLGNRLIRLSHRKAQGPKAVYLSEHAIPVLASLPRVAKNPYVIVGKRPGSHWVNLRKVWLRICDRAGLRIGDDDEQVRLHDLRHNFGGIGALLDEPLAVIGKQLGHKRVQTTERYVTVADNPVRQTSGRIAGRIASAMMPEDERTEGDIVPITKRR